MMPVLMSRCSPGCKVNPLAGVKLYPAANGVLHSERTAVVLVFLTLRGSLEWIRAKLILWSFQSMFEFYFSSQGWPRMTLWCRRDTTQRSMFSS